MLRRPTVILVHGGPGGYDHSYFRPAFDWLAEIAQVVLVDLPEHGRSDQGREADWTLEACAEGLAAFCEALSIDAPIVIGHSMGAMVGLLYATRCPQASSGLVVLAGMARYDVTRIVEGFRRVAGDDVAEIARREYGGGSTTDEERSRVRVAFGPQVLPSDVRLRLEGDADLNEIGMRELARFDVVDRIAAIECPTLVVVGDLDPVTPVSAGREIVAGLRPGIGRLEVIDGAGHWLWLDDPGRTRALLTEFVLRAAGESP